MNINNLEFINTLNIGNIEKIYKSNIGNIIIPKEGDYIYKCFLDKDLYFKEFKIYDILYNKSVLIPKFEGLGLIDNFYVLKLENIRKEFKRKDSLLDLGLEKIASLIFKIHSIEVGGKKLLLGDIHESNFFEKKIGDKVKLGIFDFSSSFFGTEVESDFSNLYIDLELNDNMFNNFLYYYGNNINFDKLYSYTVKELYERIKNGMNLSKEQKRIYYRYLLTLKNKLKGNI